MGVPPLRLLARELLEPLHDYFAVERAISIRYAFRPVCYAPMTVDPLPPNKSRTFSPGFDEYYIARMASSTRFSVRLGYLLRRLYSY